MTREAFAQKYMQTLNPQQRQAVQAVEGAVLVLAVPGSGKTTLLVHRLGYMVCCCGIDPASILTMTYTVAATGEMRQRFATLFGESSARNMQFRTINSVSAEIIGYYSETLGRASFQLDDGGEGSRILSRLYQKLNGDFPTESVLKDIATAITFIKNMMLDDEALMEYDFGVEDLPRLYKGYCQEMQRRQLMDFDDQMIYARNILRRYPAILQHFQDRFAYICVDEAQDTSKIQHEIIQMLAKKSGNLFMVGDEDQSIYGFRAAYPQALMEFPSIYPGAQVLLMEENYRSSPEIIQAANRFVRRNRQRYEKSMKPNRPSGAPVQVVQVASRTAQFQYLLALAQNCTRETAVLYRNNDSCLPLVDMLERWGMPYRCRNFEGSFFTHPIVMDVTDLIHFAHQPENEELFLHIYYKMGCCINKQDAMEACRRSRETGTPILEQLAENPMVNSYTRGAAAAMQQSMEGICRESASDALARIWSELEYGRYVENRKMDAGKFSILKLLARSESSAESLLQRLETLRSITQNHKNSPDAKLILSTVHSSKGLEYDRVYLLDVFDKILPCKTWQQAKLSGQEALYEEERRLYYVALTRAKNELNLFQCPALESEFTEEVTQHLLRETAQPGDVFAPMLQNLCGKTYTHSQRGTARITAQRGDLCLLEYEDGSLQLLTLSQMLEKRRVFLKKESQPVKLSGGQPEGSAAPAALAEPKVGMTVKHLVYGKGTITQLSGDEISVHFDKLEAVRRLSLSFCVKNQLLKILSQEL